MMGMDFCNATCRDRTDARKNARIDQMMKFNGGGERKLTHADFGWNNDRRRGPFGW